MPSPFPGMDPYLEVPDIWPDFHDAFAAEIRAVLNGSLPSPYYARLEMRPEIGVIEEAGNVWRTVPNVIVERRQGVGPVSGEAAVLDAPRTSVSESLDVTIEYELIRHPFVEIRDPSRGHKLITLIEVLSPSNKFPGEDRDKYLQKQNEVLRSDANFIQIDLLRRGDRLLREVFLHAYLAQRDPPPDYVVIVSRAWKRDGAAMGFQVLPVLITDPLPCIPVPLRQGQDDVPLDLQYVFHRAYDAGPYRRGAVDYTQPPDPPLTEERAAWVEQCLRVWGRPAPA